MTKNNKERYQTYSEIKNNYFHGIIKQIIKNARQEFFVKFKNLTGYNTNNTVLDIGTTPSTDIEQNIFLENTKDNSNITCLSNQDCSLLKNKYPNVKDFIIGDGKKTNFSDNSFDIVHSNATIEHVGSYINQSYFVKECLRISKKFVFIQTPNRYYPIDFHTAIPLIHWMPKKIHRKILNLIGLSFYSSELNLNLMTNNDLVKICEELKIINFRIIKQKLFFFTSNLILFIEKK